MDSVEEEERERAIVMQAMVACISAVGEYCHVYMFRQPARHEDDERARFINSTIRVTEMDCIAQLRMSRDAFFELCTTLREKTHLRDSRHVSLEEQVVMFLHTVGHNVRNRVIRHKFIQSEEAVSRHFNRVLDSIVSLYPEFVKQLSSETPPEIRTNISWAPYFQMVKERYYVVLVGRRPGIYMMWDDARLEVEGFSRGRHWAFKNRREAVSYWESYFGGTSAQLRSVTETHAVYVAAQLDEVDIHRSSTSSIH